MRMYSIKAFCMNLLFATNLKANKQVCGDKVSENFYCVAWSYDPLTGAPWVAVAGASGLIKIIDTSQKKVVRVSNFICTEFFGSIS